MEKNDSIEGKMFYGWLNNLAMYQQQLQQLQEAVNQKRHPGLNVDTGIELDALKELISVQQAEVISLSNEVLKRLNHLPLVTENNQKVIPFSTIIKNNHLRENIRKVERSVFYLKYHVNKLLSIAS